MEQFNTKNMFVRVTLTLLAMFCFNWTLAENITAEQALQLAKTFVSGQNSGPSGLRYSPGLTQEKQVSGLYVFNVANDGGFIIVSNDDRTTPILGFGESGHLDPDSMPSNMRAWLQGYADEIAWLQTHDVKPSRRNKAPRRVGTHSTVAIAPMVTTTWDQGSPYNNLCPTYSGSSRSATGCVATAMAQVMKYHEWPQGATKSIPGYTTDSYMLTLSTLPAVTFNWANMLNDYWGSATSAQKTAVATLMKYCGWSVQMDYGPSSGAYTDAVATALVKYFDYNTTTQYVTRSHYTYANWTDLIYHELAHERPVVYGGMSTGGGHEFVCDGYKYENGTDFFHINWGWSGTSDDYFVLSALDPDVQGIGGSSSTDGFHFGQDAVIGIQPSTGTGTIADITPHEIDLTLVDAYANPSTVLLGQSVDLVVKVTNNSQYPYDGDIMLYEETGIYNNDILSKVFYIEPGETKECVFTITPTKLGSYSFVPMRNDFYYFEEPQVHYVTFEVVEEIAEIPEGLTVCDGTVTNRQIPAYIYYFDDYARSQYVIPAADLVVMDGGIINSISFYTNSGSTFTTDSPVDVYMKEVDYTTINAFETKESATMVYQGKLRNVKLSSSRGLMTITLSTPYSYDGGNLLIGIENTDDVGYSNISFYGVNAEGASVSGYHSNSLNSVSPTQQNFLPKTTFAYEAGSSRWRKPTNLEVSEIGPRSAILSWTENSNPAATAWVVAYKAGGEENFTEVDTDTNPYTLTGLTPETEYAVKVRPVADDATIKWSNEVTFTTDVAFQAPTAVAVDHVSPTTADIAWMGNDVATSYNLRYAIGPEEDFFEDFENGLDRWTVVRNGGGNENTDWHIVNSGNVFSTNYPAHSGDYVAMSRSYDGSARNVDNWLISPQLDLGSTMTYWMMGNSYYPEHYEIWVSTTTTNLDAFTKVYESDYATDSWTEVTVDLSAYAGQQGHVAFRNVAYDKDFIFIDDVTITAPSTNLEWTTVNNVTSPYTIEGLTPGTKYTAEVQAVYADGSSKWTSTTFTTLALDAAPVNLQTADVMATTATLSWDGAQDSYKLRYRSAAIDPSAPATIILEAHDVWGDNSGYQMLLDADATAFGTFFNATSGWSATDYNAFEYTIPTDADCAVEASHVVFDGSVAIQIPAGTYDWCILNPSPGDKIYVAANNGEIPCRYDNYVFEPGKTYHFTMGIYGEGDGATLEITRDWSDWTEVGNIDNTSYELTGLTPSTVYEWQVQGKLTEGTTEWSEPATFTTNGLLELADNATDNSAIIDDNVGEVIDVKLDGRTLYKDGKWNTICLPFDVTIDGSVLEGAIARELTAASIESSTLNLTFGSAVSTLEAGTPYLIRWTVGEDIVNPVFNGVTIDATDNSFVSGSGDTRVSFLGNYDVKFFTDADTESVLLMGGNNELRFANANAGLGACRAYFQIGENGSAARITVFNIDFGEGDNTQGIISVTNITDSDDAWYTLDGRKLNGKPAMKGVYINKGNKIAIN